MIGTGSHTCGYEEYSAAGEQREALVLEHLRLVQSIAFRIHERLLPGVELEDLVSIGIVGLLAAIDNYDASRGVALGTYAHHKIRSAILDSLKGMDGIPPHKRQRAKAIQAAIRTAEQKLQRVPEEEEIAAELGMPVAEYQQSLLEVRAVTVGTFTQLETGEDLLEFVADERDESPAQVFERAELEAMIKAGLQTLPDREQTVLSLYYQEELTLREIAGIMDVHITRISQLRAQGIMRLRSFMQDRWAGRESFI